MTSPLDIHEIVDEPEFARRNPALAAWPLPVLRVVLRTLALKFGLPTMPVIADGNLVWRLEQRPTLLRPHTRYNDQLSLVQLEPDGPPVMVWPAEELADACTLLVDSVIDPPPPAPEPVDGSHIIPAGSALRDQLVLLARLDIDQAHPVEIASLLAVLTVSAHHHNRILGSLRAALALRSHLSLDPDQQAISDALRTTSHQLGPARVLLAQLQRLLDNAHRLVHDTTRQRLKH
ncbi:hypothetical protein AB0M43_14545 [Longispora sp. NPDC051575]|uniref:hypothetical protein n=1 Tax=Longispora sp. NPDC051575 TaxID=3154943 RepID=UPI00344693C5